MTDKLPDWIRWYVYEPLDWQKRVGYRVNTGGQCRFACHSQYGFFQCSRKPKMEIEGVWFCAQHGRRVLGNKPK